MNSKNCVVFKGRKDGILVMLDKDADFGEIKEQLKKKAKEAANFFGDASTALFFTGRELNERQEAELVEIFFETTNLNITFVNSGGDTIEKKKRDGDKKAEVKAKAEKSEAPPEDREAEAYAYESAAENMTCFHRGGLRSGRSLVYPGSVVLFGDLNPGAEIIAEGNIIILGSAKGLVHAGCSGSDGCFVCALNLQPTQLRISGLISYADYDTVASYRGGGRNAAARPSFAYIEGENIVIETIKL